MCLESQHRPQKPEQAARCCVQDRPAGQGTKAQILKDNTAGCNTTESKAVSWTRREPYPGSGEGAGPKKSPLHAWEGMELQKHPLEPRHEFSVEDRKTGC